MKSTRICIKVLSARGRKALALQMKDETELREKYKDVPRWKIESNIRSYLKTVSLFRPKVHPEEHQILGFKRMGSAEKKHFLIGVEKSFKENKCTVDDFEVKFYDE